MNNQLKTSRLFLALWAVASLYLCIGSLVHFHQYKIFGKQMVSEVVVSKREHKNLDGCGDDGVSSHPSSHGLQSGPQGHDLPLASIFLTRGPELPVTRVCCLANAGLRAPPLA